MAAAKLQVMPVVYSVIVRTRGSGWVAERKGGGRKDALICPVLQEMKRATCQFLECESTLSSLLTSMTAELGGAAIEV